MTLAAASKTCSRCGTLRPLSEYYRNHKSKDGRQSRCVHCERATYVDTRPRHSKVSCSIRTQRATKVEKARARRRLALLGPSKRPETRAGCLATPRPCPFATCRHNLALDIHPSTGTITLVYGSEEIEDWPRGNCALDHAQRGGMTLDEVGETLRVTRERVRQIEEGVIEKLKENESLREEAEA